MSANLTYRYRLGFDTFAEVPSGDFESIQPASHVVFGVPADSELTVKFRSKNRSIYADKNDNSILEYELGVY